MRRFLIWLLKAAVAVAAVILALRLIFPVPSTEGRQQQTSLPPRPDTTLARTMAAQTSNNPGKSGVTELAHGPDALSARLMLIDSAEQSVDAQYYIWHDDTAGRMMFKSVLTAADRGVKVRLLLDDNGVPGLDEVIASLDAHENISIRLFNPSTVRSPKLFGYAFDFFRMNRRMHNKALIVDGVATIIGGRNIGDIYFGVGEDNFYIDLDALAVGKAVADVASEFDLYWNSASAVDAALVLTAMPGDAAALLAAPGEHVSAPAEAQVLQRYAAFKAKLGSNPPFEWTNVTVIYDDPSKGLGKAKDDQLLISKFRTVAGQAKNNSELASAYFVPAKAGTRFFTDLAKSGAKVRILTNSAYANDVLLVHTGYMKYREDLLKGGVELFELKRIGPVRERETSIDLEDLTSSSSSSLHAKTFSIDNERIFIGSFNFDPRSVLLNCEMGMMIESPRMAATMANGFEKELANGAYRPELRDGSLIWLERMPDGSDRVYTTEPNMTLMQRFVLKAASYLPIEWLL